MTISRASGMLTFPANFQLLAAMNRVLGTAAVPTHGPARPGDIRHSRAKIERIRADLGYSPTVPFEEGLRQTLLWYKSLIA